jgi:N-acetylglucosaminyldiphosphoundecaprenol N-acetyl-beta-D-mannosaminyltransferase
MNANEQLKLNTVNILGVPIAAINIREAVEKIEECIQSGKQIYVTVTGVHGIMESQYHDEVKRIHRAAGMCVPDGMPTVWVGKLQGYKNMDRVYGPDLMLEVIRRSVEKGYTHFFYGGKEGVPELLTDRFVERFPLLKIVGMLSPPFGPMSEEEESKLHDLIEKLSPDILWVGLSTPKQERWMAAHVGKLNAKVMIGVGAAFDFHAGLVRQAPHWIQRIGLEWFFRLCVEPRRLWRRYLYNNPRFVLLMLLQLLRLKKFD